MKIHGIIDETTTNGPGKRTSIWTAGCTVGCKGCVNPETWDAAKGKEMGVLEIVRRIQHNKRTYDITGVSFSGGEPLEQLDDLYKVIVWLKDSNLDLDILVYSGRLISEVKDPSILKYIDIFIDGPFVEAERDTSLLWRGSRNQRVHLLSDDIKTKMRDHYGLLDQNGELIEQEVGAEFQISESGDLKMTGFGDFSQKQLKKFA